MQSLAAITRISRHQSFAISRRNLSSQQATTNPTITLYQYAICPFCNINKTLLSYTDTSYTIQEVNPLTKTEIKFSKDGYKKVPRRIRNKCPQALLPPDLWGRSF